MRESQSAFVRGCGFPCSSDPPEQLGPGRVGQVVVGKITAFQNLVDEGEARGRAIPHSHRRGAIQFDNR